MKLGYSTWGMPTVPAETAIRHVADLGYDGIELTVIPNYTMELSTLDTAARNQIKALLKETGLELPAIAAHSRILEMDEEKYGQNMARLRGAVDLAVDLAQGGQPAAINTTTGGRADQWDELKDLLVDRLGELVDYATSQGVVIALEPHVSDTLDTPAKTLELLELVGSPNLQVNFDISHFDVVGMTIEETVAALAAHSAHTHVKDQRGRAPDHEFLIPGEGNFDYVTYLKAMQAHGYEGFITAEVSVMVQRRPDYDPLAAATLSYQTLAQAFDAAGISRN